MENIIYLDSVDSTNTFLKKAAASGAQSGLIVVARKQTGGRGRMGRSFSSPSDTGIYLSRLIRPNCTPGDILPITCMSAVAVGDAIYECCNIRPDIKWVNDLYINDKKICGILTEMSISENSIEYVIVGIGVNVNTLQTDFPAELKDIATSIYEQTGVIQDIKTLSDSIVTHLIKLDQYMFSDFSYYLNEYKKRNIIPGKNINVIKPGLQIKAYANKINDDFSLNITYEDGTTENISSCDISIKKT